MTCAKKKELAEDSETLLAAAMTHEVKPVFLKGSEVLDRKDRVVLVYNKEGAIVGATTLRGARDAAARLAAIQTTMQEGVRPKEVLCADCPKLVKVNRGPLPKRCATCARANRLDQLRARHTADPQKNRDTVRAWRAANPEKTRQKNRD